MSETTGATGATNEFDALLGELETLSKAMSDDEAMKPGDDKIAAAAADGGAEPDGDEEGEDKDGDGDGAAAPMKKSFTVKLDDGTEIEAEDGTELVKSLTSRLDSTETKMAKALGEAVSMLKSMHETVNKLTADIDSLRRTGSGRRAIVSVQERPSGPAGDLAKSHGAEQPSGISANELMAKALDAQAQGKVSGFDIARAEARLNKGLPPDDSFIKAVIGDASLTK